MTGFLGNLYSNEACYSCPFCTLPRQGDITLADYWGVAGKYKSDLGVSLVLANNDKGDDWLGRLLFSGGVEIHETPFEDTLRGNPRFINANRDVPAARSAFFQDLQHTKFSQIYNKHSRM